MKSKEDIKNLIKVIGEKTGKTQAQISVGAGYAPKTLTQLMSKEEGLDTVYNQLKLAYQAVLNNSTSDNHKIEEIITSLNEIREYTIAILTGQSAGHEVMMGALDRLEQNPEGSLSAAADRLALKLVERMNVIQKGKKVGAHK